MNKLKRINIAIVDDADLTLKGWVEAFRENPEINILVAARNKESFLEQCETHREELDVLVMDKNIDGKTQLNDFEFIEETRKIFPKQKILVYTWDYYAGHINHLKNIKVNGYFPNNLKADDMEIAIKSVMGGLPYFPDDESTQASDKSKYGRGSEFDHDFIRRVCDLSLAESKVAACLAYDLHNKRIAKKLNCNIKTVEKHISSIYDCLDITPSEVHARSMFNRHYGEYFRQKYPDLLKD